MAWTVLIDRTASGGETLPLGGPTQRYATREEAEDVAQRYSIEYTRPDERVVITLREVADTAPQRSPLMPQIRNFLRGAGDPEGVPVDWLYLSPRYPIRRHVDTVFTDSRRIASGGIHGLWRHDLPDGYDPVYTLDRPDAWPSMYIRERDGATLIPRVNVKGFEIGQGRDSDSMVPPPYDHNQPQVTNEQAGRAWAVARQAMSWVLEPSPAEAKQNTEAKPAHPPRAGRKRIMEDE